MNFPEVFLRLAKALETHTIPYMLTGSFAGAFYGVARSTQDIDFVIDPTEEHLRHLITAFSHCGA